jgi:hypothetical protein
MKNVFGAICLALLIFTSSCKVNFTSSLRAKIDAQGLDPYKIQYYNSKKIVLRRVLSNSEAKVSSGEVRLQNGLLVEEITIKKNTPGICDSIFPNALLVRFEQGEGRFLMFQQNGYGDYEMKADKWDPKVIGTQTSSGYAQFLELNKGEILYDGKKYFTNTTLSKPKLKIKKDESSNFAVNKRKASGVKVQ